jgi:hypothetical protein
MEVYNSKGVMVMSPLAVFAIMLMILLNGYGCAAAAVLVKTNTTFRCDGRLDECLIEDDLQLEFLMNPYVSRVLAAGDTSGGSLNPNSAAFKACEQKHTYAECVAKFKPDHHKCEQNGVYNKSCGNKPQ